MLEAGLLQRLMRGMAELCESEEGGEEEVGSPPCLSLPEAERSVPPERGLR